MTLLQNIPQSHYPLLIEFYKGYISKLESQINDLNEEKQACLRIVESLNMESSFLPTGGNMHINNLVSPTVGGGVTFRFGGGINIPVGQKSYLERVKDVLRKSDKPLTSRQIIDIIVTNNPGFNYDVVYNNVTTVLSSDKKKGEFSEFEVIESYNSKNTYTLKEKAAMFVAAHS